MKRLLKNILLFLLLVFPLLYLLQMIVDAGLRKSRSDDFVVWTDIYSGKINAEVLICGASRAWVMTSPAILDSVLNVNSYNIGIDGWNFGMQYARFRIYCQHNIKPKYVIQCIDPSTFNKREDLYNYQRFLPYLNDSIIRRVTSEYKGAFTFSECYFPMFKYNNKYAYVKEGILAHWGKEPKSKKYKGYYPNPNKWNAAEFNSFKASRPEGVLEKVDTGTLLQFEEYLKYCRDNNIKLIFESPPVYYEGWALVKNAGEILGMAKKYAKEYNIPYLDYSTDSALSLNSDYYYNSYHLNKLGAELFSRKLAQDLKQYIK